MFEDDLSLQPKTAHERSGEDPRVETDTPPLDHTAGEGKNSLVWGAMLKANHKLDIKS